MFLKAKSIILKAFNSIKEKYNPKFYAFFPHHNIDAYKKSLFLECLDEFKQQLDTTLNNRFRQPDDIHRTIVTFWSLSKNKAILKSAKRNLIQKIFNIGSDSMAYSLKDKHIKKLLSAKCKLMCTNEDSSATEQDRKELSQVLEKKFKEKSSFEKA